jgi:glycosyltransferase involved in cell wall biosynthesis
MGAFGWRKGQEFIPLIAKLVKERGENLHFLWVGDDGTGKQSEQLLIDAERLGVADRVHFHGPVADPRRFFLASDVFSLVSREDPYPLVMLEAASHGLPVVCFDSSGGAPEFVSNERGMLVPYLDCQQFADALVSLCRDPVRAAALGENGRRYAIESHSLEAAMELILKEIEAAC